MKKLYFLLFCFVLFQINCKATVGDTTLVQAHSDIWLNYYNNFDTTVNFPDGSKSYRKIYMVFTLGKYVCPGNPQYCGDWDYTIQTFLMPKTGDTVELGRLISPYANSGNASTPASWKKRYIYDVTDYYPLLKDSATVRILYSGYSGGFTANVKFIFVEGTPMRNVLRVDKIYRSSHNYGDPNNSIENLTVPVVKTAPAGTQAAALSFTVTGHGADDNGCSEFCSKYYQVLLNNVQIAQKDIWRANCGLNQLYPQSGTWVYDRGNWCPGDKVETFHHDLPGVTSNSNYTVDVDFENYTKTGSGTPSYTVTAAVFYYDTMNRGLDADLLDVIAPNKFEGYFRENALCGQPTIKVKNNGSQTINSITFGYGLLNDAVNTFTWNGTLNSKEETVISLPEPWSLRMASGDTSLKYFDAKILMVNGQNDEDHSNNTIIVPFKSAPKWPVQIVVRLATNLATVGAVSETSWKILDLNGNVVAQRNNLAPSTAYEDTVTLGPSCYKLVVEDLGCDGLYWWANTAQGSGSFSVRSLLSFATFPLAGYFSRDFGCGFSQYFITDFPTDIHSIFNANMEAAIEASPNPARNNVTIQVSGVSIEDGMISVVNAFGQVVKEEKCNSTRQNINIENLPSGAYTVVFQNSKGKLQSKLMIVR